jgi:hypothetical protein
MYANGEGGVKRDPKLAIAFICHGSDVPAELVGMVEALTKTTPQKKLSKPFRFCDYITSGMNGGVCASDAEDRSNAVRHHDLAKLMVRWTSKQKLAFQTMDKSAEAFFAEHAGSEQDMSGTARNAFYIEEVGKLRSNLLKNLRLFEAGKLPVANDLPVADKLLNATYRSVLSQDWTDVGTLDADGVRSTQRLWLKYRDSWGAFASARYPKLSESEWKAWLTKQRVKQLEDLLPRH